MTDLQTHMHGLWLPLVTPFRDGRLDEGSLRRLTRHYCTQAIDGFILGATSGEGMTLRDAELEHLVAIVRDEMAAARRTVPVGLGLSGADTSRLNERLDETADWPIDFYLIASPYYVRPSQGGILAHFEALARSCRLADRALQHSLSLRRRHHQPDPAAARRASQYHRAEGLRREPRAIDRTAARQAERLSRTDRRGRQLFRGAQRRRRRRHLVVRPSRDRDLRRRACRAEARQPGRGRGALAGGRGADAAALH